MKPDCCDLVNGGLCKCKMDTMSRCLARTVDPCDAQIGICINWQVLPSMPVPECKVLRHSISMCMLLQYQLAHTFNCLETCRASHPCSFACCPTAAAPYYSSSCSEITTPCTGASCCESLVHFVCTSPMTAQICTAINCPGHGLANQIPLIIILSSSAAS